MPRRYEMRQRANRQAETRNRIVDAAVALHEELGPLRTTISDIASRAGVERATVYRHFPDERTLFTACIGHYFALHPLPDPEPWRGIADPETRLRLGLAEIYAYHRDTEPMIFRTSRDVPDMPAIQDIRAPYIAHWMRVREALVEPWATSEERCVLIGAAVGHAIGFATWRSLAREQGLDDREAVEAMVAMVCGLATDVRVGRQAIA